MNLISKPSIEDTSFTIVLEKSYFKKNDIIVANGAECIVIKSYNTRWYRFLVWLGFEINLSKIKVKLNNHES